MTANAATFDLDLLESRNYAVLSQSHRILSILKWRPEVVFTAHIEILVRMKPLGHNLAEILDTLHRPFIEQLSAEQRDEIATMLSESHDSNRALLGIIERAPLGIWGALYRLAVKSLCKYDAELVMHIEALKASDTRTLAFSKRDQEKLARILTNPSEPSERLRSALAKHTAPK